MRNAARWALTMALGTGLLGTGPAGAQEVLVQPDGSQLDPGDLDLPGEPATGKQPGRVPDGILDAELDADWIRELAANAKITIPADQRALAPVMRADRAAHVANGIALRNRFSGTIHLRGVPPQRRILRSLLFWNFSDGQRVGDATMPVLIDGNLVRGRKIADNSDPCWGNVGNHSYMAVVTPYTNQSGGPNQDYGVSLPYPGPAPSTSGQNPWGPVEFQDPRLSGATLVVIYEDPSGPLAVYAPGGDNMFFGSATYNFMSPGAGPALFTMLGADGQRGFGHDVFASGERTFFPTVAGPQIAGLDTVSSSDWDGSDGWPLTQLWDTHTHAVRAQAPISSVRYSAPPGASAFDCLVPVGFVIDLR